MPTDQLSVLEYMTSVQTNVLVAFCVQGTGVSLRIEVSVTRNSYAPSEHSRLELWGIVLKPNILSAPKRTFCSLKLVYNVYLPTYEIWFFLKWATIKISENINMTQTFDEEISQILSGI